VGRGAAVSAAACAVGRLGEDGPWVGFAPTLDDGYAIVVGSPDGRSHRSDADAADLLSLALVYFEEALDAPPDELAATHGDIGALVRHVAEHEDEPAMRRLVDDVVDAVDDGLAGEVTSARLRRALGDGSEPVARLRRRVAELLERG
jgi:hypothetical protein